ncbi:hypothetical protein [Wolbachia endosymbiont (group B) of Sphaerophoria taeniata]|nr:hypothetical protein [Wolbachia endosymbiont (group B) of Sphaerophoria taeniata]
MPTMCHIAMFVQLRLKSIRKGVIPLPPLLSSQSGIQEYKNGE